MSAGPLIASGIGILLLIVTAYVLVGGTLATTEVVVEAQSNLATHQEARMRTAITILNTTILNTTPADKTLYVEVKNTGSEPIIDLSSVDVYLMSEGVPVYVPYGNRNTVEIVPDAVHPGTFDPGETLNLSIAYTEDANPTWVQVVTPNGVSSSAYIQ